MRLTVLALAILTMASHASAQVTCGAPGADFTAPAGSSVVNAYYPGPAMSGLVNVAAGATSIPVDVTGLRGTGTIAAGDLLLVVQMQGATIDHTGQNAVGGTYGDGAGGDDRMGSIAGATFVAGTYELVVASGAAGATIPLRTPLRNAYSHSSTVVDNGDGTSIGFRRYQVVRVGEYRNLTVPVGATLTSVPWDGRNGGIVALDVSGTLALNGTIDTSFMGFRGGSTAIPAGTDDPQPAFKGESLAGPVARMYGLPVTAGATLTVTTATTGIFGGDNGRGAPANGGGCPSTGGGGLGTYNDSGGGGGGGGGDGGVGSIGPIAGTAATIPRGGAGYNDATRVFLGGGGGSGSVDDPVGVNGISGQPGGGIIYVRAATVSGTGSMVTDGRSGITNLMQEGGGGGGGGGSIFLYTGTTTLTGITLRARGGNGTSTLEADDGGGGGGGGGHVVVATPGGTAMATVDVAGGTGGSSPTAGDGGGGTGGFQQVAAPPLGSSCPAVCGDGTITAPETCDDSNTTAGDGCGTTCRREVVVVAPAEGSVTNDTTPTISGTADPGATVNITVGTVTRTATANASGNWTTTIPAGSALAPGMYTATATATATDGSTSMDANTFRIDNTTTVAITDPSSGEVTDATPTISGTGEPGATVVVSIDGTVRGMATVTAGGTWTLTSPTLAAGPHNVSVVATDTAGNTASAGPVPFVVDASTTVTITSPASGARTSATPTITGTGEPGATVTIRIDGTVIGTATVGAGGTWSIVSPVLASGMHNVRADAVDALGNTASAGPVSFVVDDATMVAITAPTSGATTDATPTITGTGEAGATVTVSIDGTVVGTATVTPGGTWTLTSSTLAAGMHMVSVVARDTTGNMASAGPVPFVVDDTTTVAITDPSSGEVTDATPTISGTGEVGATVTVRVDGAVVGTATVGAGGTWTLTSSTLAAGPHNVSVSSTDPVGNTATAGPVPFVVDDTTTVAITAPTAGATTSATPTISGTGEPGATVVVSVDGTVVGTATVTGGGTWSVTAPTLTDGPHTATATATDAVGNTATATPVPFIVDGGTTVAILVPDEGERVLDTTPTISGTGEAGADVEVVLTGPSGEMVTLTATVAADGTWSVTPTTALANGAWSAVATATDDAGNVATDMQAFFVGAGTFVVITAPADGSSTSDTTPTITGTGTPGAMVTVVVGGMTLGPVTVAADGTWSVTVPSALADGTYTATATLTATGGMTATDDSTFTIDAGTVVDFLQPGDEGPIGDETPELTGTGEPGASVVVTLDGAVVGTVTVDADGNWSLQLTTPLAEGAHSVSVTATDDEGNTATDTGSFTVDLDVPSLEIDAPADQSTTSDTTPTITGRTDPRASVTVIVDGRILGVATSDEHGVWSFPVTTALTAGEHTVQATTTNAAGLTANDEHDFTIDADAPAIDIVSPANGASTADTTPTISGTSEPGASVQVFVGGVLIGTVTADGSGAWTIDVPTALPDGDHTVRAVATDGAGNVATDNGTFIVDTATFVTITTPADESTIAAIRPRFSGTSEPGAMVEVSVDGTVIGTVTAAADGSWAIDQPSDLSAGVHTVSAEATDEVGNTATASNDFTIDTTIMDTDMDGLVDPTECPTPGSCPDTDGDGDPDFEDPDDDGDGIPTRLECTTPGSCVDSDEDGTPDYLDPDDDGDGVPTRDERPGDVSQDTDGDTRPNHLDPDDDGDGIPTMEECPMPADCRDTDGDTTPDYLDPDDDDDGILTSRERADGMMFGDDVDDDGLPNWLDTESDGDGVDDMVEGLIDTDGMGPPDYLDPNFPMEMPDGGLPDGSVVDGSVLDAGPISTVGGISGGACGCRVAPHESAGRGLWLLLVGLGIAIWRRRR